MTEGDLVSRTRAKQGGGWSFTALYSNTARAQELDKTDDWVVVYFERDGEETQCTVLTNPQTSLSRGSSHGCLSPEMPPLLGGEEIPRTAVPGDLPA